MSSSRLQTEWVLLSAHPDDEVIGAAWILLSGQPLAVAELTDGVPVDRRWWSDAACSADGAYRAQRRSESEDALAVAGLPPSALHRLGGRDLAAIDEAPRLVRALAALLDRVRPARLCTHAYEGGHPDHDTAALVGRAAVSLASVAPDLWEMTSYHLGPGGAPAAATGRFQCADMPEELRVLSPTKQEAKLKMFAAHRTQAGVLRRFPIDVERQRPAPRYDFTRPPHPGELDYERLGWGEGTVWRRKAAEALKRLELAEDGCRRS